MQRIVRTVIARALAGLGLAFLLSVSFAGAQEPLGSEAQTAAPKRWLVVLCGLPGDQLHRERMTQAARQIVAAAGPVLLVPKERVKILVGDDEMAQAVGQSAGRVGVCNAESMESLFRSLGGQIAAEDACWIITIGHAQPFGNRSTFNVQGPDVDAERFARMLAPLKCGQRVFVLTMPLSGLWIKPLKGPESVCIAATEAGPELTATEMPYALADILAGKPAHQGLTDIDEDGAITLLDLYLAVSLEVHQRYEALERLQTEHSQLDDNGDGVGKELQEPYLPQDEEEEAAASANLARRAARTLHGDGALARTIAVGTPAAAETKTAEEPAADDAPVPSDAE